MLLVVCATLHAVATHRCGRLRMRHSGQPLPLACRWSRRTCSWLCHAGQRIAASVSECAAHWTLACPVQINIIDATNGIFMVSKLCSSHWLARHGRASTCLCTTAGVTTDGRMAAHLAGTSTYSGERCSVVPLTPQRVCGCGSRLLACARASVPMRNPTTTLPAEWQRVCHRQRYLVLQHC